MSMEPVELGSFECHCKLCEASVGGFDALTVRPPWRFPDSHPDEGAITTRRVLAGITPIEGVLHWHDGTWEFLDDEPMGVDELAVAPLRCLVELFPSVAQFAHLPRGRQMWLEGDRWTTTDLRIRPERPG